MRSPASFILLFQEPVHQTADVRASTGTMTKTFTWREESDFDRSMSALGTATFTKSREASDQDAERAGQTTFPPARSTPSVSLGTQTFTEAREQLDQDPQRYGHTALPSARTFVSVAMGTGTRTDAREETDQDCSAPGGIFAANGLARTDLHVDSVR
jgi:hypothetical protein